MTPIDQLNKAETTAPFEGETPSPNGTTTDPNLRIYCGIESSIYFDMTFFADGDVGVGIGEDSMPGIFGAILTRTSAQVFFTRALELLASGHGVEK